MLDWLSARADVIGLAISLCTLLVWIVYAQLLFAGFRRQRRPSLMLNRGHGHGLDALCVVGNMSAEGIFVQYVIAELEDGENVVRVDVTDRDEPPSDRHGRTSSSHDGGPDTGDGPSGGDEEEREGDGEGTARARGARTTSVLSDLTHQGPLQSNGTFHIGSFGRLLDRLLARSDAEGGAVRESGDGPTTERSLTVRLIASYGPENRPIGAERTFRITPGEDGEASVVPESWYTRRLVSRAERRELERQIRDIHRRELEAIAAG